MSRADGDSWTGNYGFLDGDDFGEHFLIGGGRVELLYTFLSTEDTENCNNFLSTEDGDSWIFGWG